MRCYRIFCHFIFTKPNWTSNTQTFKFGADEFGRDVEKGLLKYVAILKARGIKLHAVLVLGSRVKSRSQPKSDIDVTVIASNLPKEINILGLGRLFGLRRWFLLSDIPLFMGIETSNCCSREEFLHKLEEFDIHTLDALYYGKIIYHDGFWEQIQRVFRGIEEKYDLKKLNLKSRLSIV